jgi:hypothetical protein
MSKLKPIGSEKLKGQAQISRILEIAKYNEHLPNSINETAKTDYTTKLVDGNVYHIVKEKMGYIIKSGINESSLDYMDPMKNRVYYTSYSEALKKLNLVAKELNRVHNINEGISLFTEDKKYFLKNPNPAPQEEETPPPAPMPEPMSEPTPPSEPMDTEPPADPEMGMDTDMPEEPSDEMPAPGPDDAGEEGDVSFKMIQKLTGKLAQKIRDFQEKDEEITSKDAKYVVNSILSALADNLEDDDKDDIIAKLEGEEDEEDVSDMGMDNEMPEEEPTGEEMGTDEMPEEEPTGEMAEGEMANLPAGGRGDAEVSEKYVEAALKKIFKESKVDDVLSKYFVVTESEKKFQEQKKQNKQLVLEQKRKTDKNQIARLSETVKQKKVATDVINSFPEMKFVGKTNKGNLVFEHNNKQLKVSPKGELL